VINKKRQKRFYLVIAFAIMWVSFASIIQFHIEQIHGRSYFNTIEFIKTENQTSCKKNAHLSFKIDLNSGILDADFKEPQELYHAYSLLLTEDVFQSLFQHHLETPSLRGPPALL